MRLQQYIITEGSRGISISEDEVLELISSKCKNAVKDIKKGFRILRGVEHIKPFLLYKPKDYGNRKSASIPNYYSLIVDNSPAWNGYPKRRDSLICTTSISTALFFSTNVYSVLPFNGSKIALCDDKDFWGTFKRVLNNGSLYDLTKTISATFMFLRLKLSDKSYNDIVKSFKSFDNFIASNPHMIKELRNKFPFVSMWIDIYPKYNDLLKCFQSLLTPKNGNIKLIKPGEGSFVKDIEVWTDGECVLIYEPGGKVNIGDVTNKLIEKAGL